MKLARNPWPYAIVGFFVLFLAGVATVIIIASRQNDSLVSKDYYEQELKFQDQLQAAARANDAAAAIGLDAGGQKLCVAIPAALVKTNLSGQILFYRPSSPALDREVRFQPDEKGIHIVDLSDFAPGAWTVRVRWNVAGQDYYLEKKINLSAK